MAEDLVSSEPHLFLTVDDITPFLDIEVSTERLELMIDDVEAEALLIAPELADLATLITDDSKRSLVGRQVKSILRGALIRWAKFDGGMVSSETDVMGPFTNTRIVDTKTNHAGIFYTLEKDNLLRVLHGIVGKNKTRAWGLDQIKSATNSHSSICDLHFGSLTCSCGANLTTGLYPLWEV